MRAPNIPFSKLASPRSRCTLLDKWLWKAMHHGTGTRSFSYSNQFRTMLIRPRAVSRQQGRCRPVHRFVRPQSSG